MLLQHVFSTLLTNGFDHDSIEPLPNTLDIGPLSLPLYGLLIMTGVLLAVWIGVPEGKKLGIPVDHILDGLLIILPLSLLGTRLWYVIFEWDQFKDYLPSILGFQEGGGFTGLTGLAIHGGFITAVVSTIIYTRARKINLFSGLDIVAPGFLIAQSLGRWGNFFNQEAVGGVIGGVENGSAVLDWDAQRSFLSDTLRLPNFIVNNMFLNPSTGGQGWHYYHPAFLYESVWNITGLIIVLVLRRTKFVRRGDMMAFYLIWYSIGRFFIESLRTDSLYLWGTGIRTAQAISILMILAGIILIIINRKIIPQERYATVLHQNTVK